jgi:hypothetical protein
MQSNLAWLKRAVLSYLNIFLYAGLFFFILSPDYRFCFARMLWFWFFLVCLIRLFASRWLIGERKCFGISFRSVYLPSRCFSFYINFTSQGIKKIILLFVFKCVFVLYLYCICIILLFRNNSWLIVFIKM